MRVAVSVQPAARVTLVDTVMERIRAAIETGGLQAGDRLPGELEWSRQLQVSRPVVREAVGRLQSLGVLHVSPGRGRGMVVGGQDAVLAAARLVRSAIAVSPKQLDQFNQFRAALEIHAARLSAQRATAEQVAHLEQLCDGLDEPSPTAPQAVEADFRFHRAIAESIDNPVILHTLEVLQEIVKHSIRQARRRNRGRPVDSRRVHRRIVAAIRRGDAEAAARAMTEHFADPAPAAGRTAAGAKSRLNTTLGCLVALALALSMRISHAAEPAVPATLEQRLLAEPAPQLVAAARSEGDPRRGALVFFQHHLACARCHATGERTNPLAPDLAQLPPDTTAEHVVESLLEPSKHVRRGYEATVIELHDGTALTALVVSENGQTLAVRDVGQNGQLREIPLADIAARETASQSIMPSGQANLLAGRHQFIDLLAYLLEIAEHGPARARELRPPESLIQPPPAAPDTAGDRPRVFRTLMPESGPGALAIGLGPALWACFDPNRGGINYAWQGTLELAPTLAQKINEPAAVSGQLFYRDATTGPLRPGSRDRLPHIKFLGYAFAPPGVVLRYQADAVLVEEQLSADALGTGLVRRLQFSAPSPTTLWLPADVPSGCQLSVRGAQADEGGWRIDLSEPAIVEIHIQPITTQP